jgi:hypothetical protein
MSEHDEEAEAQANCPHEKFSRSFYGGDEEHGEDCGYSTCDGCGKVMHHDYGHPELFGSDHNWNDQFFPNAFTASPSKDHLVGQQFHEIIRHSISEHDEEDMEGRAKE